MPEAFSDEQKAAIAEIVTASLKASTTSQDKPNSPAGDKDKASNPPADSDKNKSIAEQAKAQVQAENAAKVALAEVETSIQFNLGIGDFVEKNKALLPDEAAKILSTVATKTFKDANEKANTLRKSLLDSFLSQKENIDCLIPSLAARAEQYKALAESDKERRSGEFWDLAETGVALKHGKRKADALKQINGGNSGEPSGNPLEDKILAAAKKKFNI
jgi:hypothetical protein